MSCAYTYGMEGRSIEAGLHRLMEADVIVGHNAIKFDVPAIQKVYPWFKPKGIVRDTMVMARLISPEIKKSDLGLAKSNKLPRNMIGRYSLQAFGYRMGNYKGDYSGGWDTWNQEMQDYCEQDVRVTAMLWQKLMAKKVKRGFSDYSIELEHDVAAIIARQERNGFGFNVAKAQALYADLVEHRTRLERDLQVAFPPWEVRTPLVPKANNKTRGYVKGQLTYKVKTVEFNPSSRHHIADRLKTLFNWEPKEFTDDGQPKLDDAVLGQLPYPEAKVLAEYLMVQKRIGQVAEGKEAWLRHEKNGRIHGGVVTNGAVTGRMTHMKPNVGQTPANDVPYGERCRDCWEPRKGWDQLGCDADALEARCLAHYMAAYDNGAYIEATLRGDKSKGTDTHSVNARALGLDPKKYYKIDGIEVSGRDIAKTWFYAFIYGAGDWKLGHTLGHRGDDKLITAKGKRARANLLKGVAAIGKLTEGVHKKVMESGELRGMDGRKLSVRSKHSALNTLLQSAGAIAMKAALVILDRKLQSAGLVPGKDYEYMANVHDEWQIECRPEVSAQIGEAAKAAIREAGEVLKFRCPLDGQYKTGASWAQTH